MGFCGVFCLASSCIKTCLLKIMSSHLNVVNWSNCSLWSSMLGPPASRLYFSIIDQVHVFYGLYYTLWNEYINIIATKNPKLLHVYEIAYNLFVFLIASNSYIKADFWWQFGIEHQRWQRWQFTHSHFKSLPKWRRRPSLYWWCYSQRWHFYILL